MRIIFTEDAKSDLEELRRYLEPLSPKGLANVVAALERRIAIASENPRSGRPIPRPDVREAVEPRYGFVSLRMIFTCCSFIDRCAGRWIIPS